MKAYAIIMTIAFFSQFLLVMIYADKLRNKERDVLLSENLVTPVFAKVEIPMEDLITDGRAEEKKGAELFLKLRECGCIQVWQLNNERDYTTTAKCVVFARHLNLN